MAAEALNKHFQKHKRCKPSDKNLISPVFADDLPKCKPFHSKRSNIYVHEFFDVKQDPVNCESFQNELHRYLYSHESGHHQQNHLSKQIKSRSFQDNNASKPHSSSNKYVKSPVYSYSSTKAQKVLKGRNTIAKLEESYWANWKPNRSEIAESRKIPKAHYRVIQKHSPLPRQESTSLSVDKYDDEQENENHSYKKETEDKKEIKVIAEAQIDSLTKNNSEELDVKDSSEIQTKKSEVIQVPADLSQKDVSVSLAEAVTNKEEKLIKNEESDEVTPLKHVDSIILTAKKQSEERPRYQQPRCIKLFRKPVVSGAVAAVTRGGSYPLKLAIKKEKSVVKGNIRLGKPGSPIMIQTNKGKKGIH